VLDERVRAVLERLESEDEQERADGVPPEQRSLAVGPEAGRVLFALVSGTPASRVLEIGASRGYSTLWLAAAARILGGRVVSLEADPVKCAAWRRTVEDAGLEEHAELVPGDALVTLAQRDERFDVVFLDAWNRDYEELFSLARGKIGPGAVVVADNVVSHAEELAPWVAARQSDQSLVSVTVPVGSGLQVMTVLQP
jgi:predicted O-methyltransferase YrrM